MKYEILFSHHYHDTFEYWNQSAFEIIWKIISVAKVVDLRQENRNGKVENRIGYLLLIGALYFEHESR